MKQLIFAVIAALSTLFAAAQNGGQAPENDNIRIEYVGKVGANYYDRIVNKKACEVTVKTEYNHVFGQVTIPANSSYQFDLGTTLLSGLRVKTIQVNCGSPDNGWVEYSLTAMPLTFTSNPLIRYDKATDMVYVQVSVADVRNVKNIRLRVSFDGGYTKKPLGLVFLDYTNPNTTYTYHIKRTDLLKLQGIQ